MTKSTELVDDDFNKDHDDNIVTVLPHTPTSKFPIIARVGVGLAAAVVFVVLCLFVGPLIAPQSYVKALSEHIVREITGMDTVIAGESDLTIMPSVRLRATDVMLRPADSNVSRMDVATVDIEVSTFGIVSGSLDVHSVFLDRPVITYRSEPANNAPGALDATWGWWRNLAVRELNVENGAVLMESPSAEGLAVLSAINLSSAPIKDDGEEGLRINGSATAGSQSLSLNVHTSELRLLAAGNRWPVRVEVQSGAIAAVIEGGLALRERLMGDGSIRVRDTSIQQLAGLIGIEPSSLTDANVDLTADLKSAGASFIVEKVRATVGNAIYEGAFSRTATGEGASTVAGRLNATELDLDAVGLSVISSVLGMLPVGEIEFQWQQAARRGQVFGPGAATLSRTVHGGGAEITVEEASAFGGVLRGSIRTSRSEGAKAISARFRLVGAAVGSMLGLGVGDLEPPISGGATLTTDIFTVGRNHNELWQALTGTADLTLSDGYLNVPALAEAVSPVQSARRFKFDSVNGRFDIAQGVARSDDLILQGEGLSLVGQGMIDLVDGTIDLSVGRLESADGNRSLVRYRLHGASHDIQVETSN